MAPLSARMIELTIRRARNAAGILKPFTAMTLRHTYAVHCLENGESIRELQHALGHQHIKDGRKTFRPFNTRCILPPNLESPLDPIKRHLPQVSGFIPHPFPRSLRPPLRPPNHCPAVRSPLYRTLRRAIHPFLPAAEDPHQRTLPRPPPLAKWVPVSYGTNRAGTTISFTEPPVFQRTVGQYWPTSQNPKPKMGNVHYAEVLTSSDLFSKLNSMSPHKIDLSSPDVFRLVLEQSGIEMAIHEIVLDKDGRPVDCAFLDSNPAFESHTACGIRISSGAAFPRCFPAFGKHRLSRFPERSR